MRASSWKIVEPTLPAPHLHLLLRPGIANALALVVTGAWWW